MQVDLERYRISDSVKVSVCLHPQTRISVSALKMYGKICVIHVLLLSPHKNVIRILLSPFLQTSTMAAFYKKDVRQVVILKINNN